MAATVAPAGHICVLRSNGDDGNRIPLDASAAATVTFGRALTSDVRIALAHCSRLHAELRVDQNARVSLVNHAKAANATLLNAQPLAPKAARDVRDGDVFEICGKRFRFEASVLAATTTRVAIVAANNATSEATRAVVAAAVALGAGVGAVQAVVLLAGATPLLRAIGARGAACVARALPQSAVRQLLLSGTTLCDTGGTDQSGLLALARGPLLRRLVGERRRPRLERGLLLRALARLGRLRRF